MSITYNDTSSVFVYSGVWAAESSLSGSLHVTSDVTASVSFTFPVAATGFSIYGIRQGAGGLYNICIDCAPGAPYDSLVDGIAAPGVGPTPPTPLYQWSFPAPGFHTVVLRVQPDGRGSPIGNSVLAFAGFVLASVATPASFIINLNSSSDAFTSTTSPAQTTLPALGTVQPSSRTPLASTTALTTDTTNDTTNNTTNDTTTDTTTDTISATTTGTITGTTTASTNTTNTTRSAVPPLSSTSPTTTSAPSSALSSPTAPSAFALTATASPPHAGLVIGSALGALALLCGLVALFHFRRRRPRVAVTPYSTRWGTGGASVGGGSTAARSEYSGKGKIMDGGAVSRADDEDGPSPPPAY
ncbi:hypothetical protein HYPSUDRAFT_198181 [Hypholoma sublateritium FD-334 SS-4]|uniref:Uncharacterized protein n=1 Tax=Hypholoma sublateritium (strain FD-334 SS-4) TaxID=945553 RepID=A0A0D2PFR5_HYPSF|nr:hypothetical protein HYPSUDRAFT_198181 [Hypholoma sublateritium FD-334 SS-4]